MSRGKFWMVLGSGEPTMRHPSKKSAQNEAERLAKLAPGREFVVLESLATVVKSDLQWEQNNIDNSETYADIPF